MTEAAPLSPGEKVLEIGTGSGYQAAVLAELPGVAVLVIPVGRAGEQDLRVITRGKDGTTNETLFPVRFVPMTGESQRARD